MPGRRPGCGARPVLDPDLGTQAAVLAQLLGERGTACPDLLAPPCALDRDDLHPGLASQGETHLAHEPFPALDDLHGPSVATAQRLVIDVVADGNPRCAHVLEAVASGVSNR
ncbi:hypothetical protein GCM10025734_83270 [Kitasatospora paranensis]